MKRIRYAAPIQLKSDLNQIGLLLDLKQDLDPKLSADENEDQLWCNEGLILAAAADHRQGAPAKTGASRRRSHASRWRQGLRVVEVETWSSRSGCHGGRAATISSQGRKGGGESLSRLAAKIWSAGT